LWTLPWGAEESETVGDREMQIPEGSPLFFVSYPRSRLRTSRTTAQGNADRYVQEFFEALSDHVRELVGRSTGADPGFLDQSMDGGRQWEPDMLRAVGSCQVFIPLISPSLFESDWCGKEWDAFAKRTVINRKTKKSDEESAIVPVTWLPTKEADPEIVQRIHRFEPKRLPDPDTRDLYWSEGIYGLRVIQEDRHYQIAVWHLAQRIRDIYWSHWVEPKVIENSTGLNNVFDLGEDA
jgi:hypothetical protein